MLRNFSEVVQLVVEDSFKSVIWKFEDVVNDVKTSFPRVNKIEVPANQANTFALNMFVTDDIDPFRKISSVDVRLKVRVEDDQVGHVVADV